MMMVVVVVLMMVVFDDDDGSVGVCNDAYDDCGVDGDDGGSDHCGGVCGVDDDYVSLV